jgi:predicted nucleic acid-binding protein
MSDKPLTQAYVDTNIFDYVALRHPKYGKACKNIMDDIRDEVFEAYCSYLVPIEILGSLARVDRKIAHGAIQAFFSFPIKMINVDESLLKKASEIIAETGLTYDSIHAAAMSLAGLDTVITEDTEHWKKVKDLRVVSPEDYTNIKANPIH